MDLLDSELKTSLLKHYFEQKKTVDLLKVTLNSYMEQLLVYNRRYPFREGDKNTYLGKLAWNIENEQDFVMGFNSVIAYHQHALRINLTHYENLLISTRNLLIVLKAKK
jgi:hypothetical protein